MAPTVQALFDSGNTVIFDHVLHNRLMYEGNFRAFDGLDMFNIGVFRPIEVLEARERARGHPIMGRARGLIDVVHNFIEYDLTVDTGAANVDACVDEILVSLRARRDRSIPP